MYYRVDERLTDCLKGILPSVFTVYLSYGCPKGDIFLYECQAWFYGREDGFIDTRLIEEDLFLGPFESGAFDLGIGKIAFTGRRIG